MHLYNLEQKGAVGIVSLAGEVTIQYGDELKNLFLDACNRCNIIRVSLGEVTEIDISGLQLFCALHKTCSKLSKTMEIDGKKSYTVCSAAHEAGFLRERGCMNDCMWTRME